MENQLIAYPLVATKALQIWDIENGTFDKRASSGLARVLCVQLELIVSQYFNNEHIVSIIVMCQNFPINTLCTLKLL